MTVQVHESHVLEAKAVEGKSGRLLVKVISPGWGSSGYYSQQVLENAGQAKVFPAGTHMYFDHPSESESYDRPERSVRDLAAVFETDAVWSDEHGALVGEAQVFGPYRELLTDEHFAKAIGTSIIASAEVTTGEAEGRQGRIVTNLIEGRSVDFVTHAGRGGSILSVMESARPERVTARAVQRGVAEATANETREQIEKTVRATYGGDRTYTWVRDFDEATVWFSVEDEASSKLYAQPYSLDANERAVLDGDPVEVRATTVYVPVTVNAQEGTPDVSAPAGRTTHTPTSEEDNMGTIQVDEADHRRVTEAAGRVPELETQLAESQAREAAATAELAETRRAIAAGPVIDRAAEAADITFSALERRALLVGLPATEAGALDVEAFEATCAEEAARVAESRGRGSITGFGRTQTSGGAYSVEAFDQAASGQKG